jgi:hypothetical protein
VFIRIGGDTCGKKSKVQIDGTVGNANVNGRLVMLMIGWWYNMQRFRVISTTGDRRTLGKETRLERDG